MTHKNVSADMQLNTRQQEELSVELLALVIACHRNSAVVRIEMS